MIALHASSIVEGEGRFCLSRLRNELRGYENQWYAFLFVTFAQ
jgi:hypothetical protein